MKVLREPNHRSHRRIGTSTILFWRLIALCSGLTMSGAPTLNADCTSTSSLTLYQRQQLTGAAKLRPTLYWHNQEQYSLILSVTPPRSLPAPVLWLKRAPQADWLRARRPGRVTGFASAVQAINRSSASTSTIPPRTRGARTCFDLEKKKSYRVWEEPGACSDTRQKQLKIERPGD